MVIVLTFVIDFIGLLVSRDWSDTFVVPNLLLNYTDVFYVSSLLHISEEMSEI